MLEAKTLFLQLLEEKTEFSQSFHSKTYWVQYGEFRYLNVRRLLGGAADWFLGPSVCRGVRERESIWHRVGLADRESDFGHTAERHLGIGHAW